MTFNFTLAEKQGGKCVLRFDDTNPEAEKQEYIDNIIENVHFMEFTPAAINYSSDYFPQLYELAIKLIKSGHAYVCHQSKKEMEECRATYGPHSTNIKPSPWRDRSVEENLRLFELMRVGYFKEGEASLRMKGDLKSPNPNMWDHVAYRIKYTPHPHVGNKWCVYPTYDYTHCIIDSLEWMSASCCTLEFENRRESYFWLLDVLDLYKPVVWEYSRLNITYNVLSKRKLLKLVFGKYVRGWDDPRMITINGLRRRGFTAQVLKLFCDRVGVTRKENHVAPHVLEACAREVFNTQCPRAMCVIYPLRITISNYPENKTEKISCPNFPLDLSKGYHDVPFSRVIYIDESDFQEQADKKYFGLTLGKTVRLKYAYNITCEKVIRNNKGKIQELICTYDETSHHDPKGIKKGHLTWVSNGYPCEIRSYGLLFKSEFPEGESDTWLDDLNPESELVNQGLIDEFAMNSGHERYQFGRFGYYVKDKDYTKEKPFFNRIVTLKESSEKQKLKN